MDAVSDRLSWIETDASALKHNVQTFKRLVGSQRRLLVVVKGNAYGHCMIPCARIAVESGADWLGVFNIQEALALRLAKIEAPILVFGPTPQGMLEDAARRSISITVGSPYAVQQILDSGVGGLKVHLKIETGTNRQGFQVQDFAVIPRLLSNGKVEIEGMYTHFADIEDTTDHSYAEEQLARFVSAAEVLKPMGVNPPIKHSACSAATILFPDTYFDMVRLGIAAYGMWPSKETLVSARQLQRENIALKPVMTWKTRISQIKNLEPGEFVGYGRTFKATRRMRLAIIPVGYANGYDRGISNNGYVLVNGMRAAICGRIMMNMSCIDVTDVPDAGEGAEVVLLGRQGAENISAETMASWVGSINYEIVTRAEPDSSRVIVNC